MILADTSVWIDHLRGNNNLLMPLLEANRIVLHPMIIGELACGNLRNRKEVLTLLQQLPTINNANHEEVLYGMEQHGWMGKGIGWVDAHLLASVLLTPNTTLWSQDRRLNNLAQSVGAAFCPNP